MQSCGSGILIPDPNFSMPDPGSRVEKIPDPGSRVEKIPDPDLHQLDMAFGFESQTLNDQFSSER
jgi:hypothetical protein